MNTSEKQDQPAKAANKLSWDMSRGNWVDADFSGLKNLHEKFSAICRLCNVSLKY